MQSHLQKLLSSVKLPGGERQCAEAQLKVSRRMFRDGPNISDAEQGEARTGKLQGGSSGHLSINKTLDMIRQWYSWLHARINVELWCQ
jgi:hypothetical protein